MYGVRVSTHALSVQVNLEYSSQENVFRVQGVRIQGYLAHKKTCRGFRVYGCAASVANGSNPQLLYTNVQRFRGGLVWTVIKKKKVWV